MLPISWDIIKFMCHNDALMRKFWKERTTDFYFHSKRLYHLSNFIYIPKETSGGHPLGLLSAVNERSVSSRFKNPNWNDGLKLLYRLPMFAASVNLNSKICARKKNLHSINEKLFINGDQHFKWTRLYNSLCFDLSVKCRRIN